MQDSQKVSRCPVCGKTFFRKAHMLRHQSQHTGIRPYNCQFCEKSFKRSDVLRDHYSRCGRRGDRAIPKQEERGRKRHACDHCARLKIKCDGEETPCRKCADFGRTCVRSRGNRASTGSEAGSPPDNTSAEFTTADRNSISFLLNDSAGVNFAKRFSESAVSEQSSVTDAVDYGEASEPAGVLAFDRGTMGMDGAPFVYDPAPFFGADDTSINSFITGLGMSAFHQASSWHAPHGRGMEQPNDQRGLRGRDWSALSIRVEEIKAKLRQAVDELTRSRPPMDCRLIFQAIESITPPRLDQAVKLYFRHWHKHGCIIHEHSFDPITAALPLVMAVMCIGWQYFKSHFEVTQVKLLLDFMEHAIYSHGTIASYYEIQNIGDLVRDDRLDMWVKLQELQGAYLIIVIQYWVNHSAAQRVRQLRFARVVAMARALKLPIARHPEHFEVKDEASFNQWLLQETMIRTVVTMGLLDNAFVMFNNMPPRLGFLESINPLPCEEADFAVGSYQEAQMNNRTFRQKCTVRFAFQKLFANPEQNINVLEPLQEAGLSMFDLHILIHHLYTYIWKQTFANPLAEISPVFTITKPLRVALQNWSVLWQKVRSRATREEWAASGFQRLAESYWQLTKAVLQSFEKRGGHFEPIEIDCSETSKHLRRILSSPSNS